MPRKQVTSRFRGTDIFSRRIVITVTRSGLLLVIGAIVLAGTRFPYSIITIISVICTGIALVTTVEARHQVRNLRYEVQEKEVALLEHWQLPEDMPDLRASVEAAFEEDEDEDGAKATFIRLPINRRRPAS